MIDVSKPLDRSLFEADRSVDVVNARMAADMNPRLREIMAIVVKHLHAATREAKIGIDEWMAAIQFLTSVGHMCSDWRQEFILLSDVLGVSMLVDAINHERPQNATENTVLGPFHVADVPRYPNGSNICLDGQGEPLVVRGRVVDTAGSPIGGALLDIWAANEDGFYDVQQQGVQPENNLRGVFQTEPDGTFWFRTVKPRFYPIPDDGPVGKLLADLGRHPYRPAHLHFIVAASGFETVVTHIFTPDCPYLAEDAVFGVKKSLIADFRKIDDPDEAKHLGFSNPFWSVEQEFVLVPRNEPSVGHP